MYKVALGSDGILYRSRSTLGVAELTLFGGHDCVTLAYGCQPLLAILYGLIVVALVGDDIKMHGVAIRSLHIRIVDMYFHVYA